MNFFGIFKITDESSANKRLLGRSLLLTILTVIGFAVTEYLVQMNFFKQLQIVDRFPELLIMFRTAAIMTFIELTVLWIRMVVQPGTDVQQAARKAVTEQMPAAIVYFTHMLWWAMRVFVFLKLSGLGSVVS